MDGFKIFISGLMCILAITAKIQGQDFHESDPRFLGRLLAEIEVEILDFMETLSGQTLSLKEIIPPSLDDFENFEELKLKHEEIDDHLLELEMQKNMVIALKKKDGKIAEAQALQRQFDSILIKNEIARVIIFDFKNRLHQQPGGFEILDIEPPAEIESTTATATTTATTTKKVKTTTTTTPRPEIKTTRKPKRSKKKSSSDNFSKFLSVLLKKKRALIKAIEKKAAAYHKWKSAFFGHYDYCY